MVQGEGLPVSGITKTQLACPSAWRSRLALGWVSCTWRMTTWRANNGNGDRVKLARSRVARAGALPHGALAMVMSEAEMRGHGSQERHPVSSA